MTRSLVTLDENLWQAMAESRASGHAASVEELERTSRAAYETYSDYLSEVGVALVRVLKQHGKELPPDTTARLRLCLAEVDKAWPKYLP